MSVPAEPPSAVRWTGRAFLLLGVGAALLVFAVLLENSVPVFLALPLLAAPFAAPWTAPKGLGSVDLRWEESGAGSEVEVTGELSGRLDGGEREVEVVFALPATIRERRPTEYRYTTDRVAFSASWSIVEPMVVTLPAPLVEWADPLGLSRRELGGARPDLRLDRYPAGLQDLSTVRLHRTIQLPGESRSRRIGATGEFFGLREAVPGEPMRQINWAATARAGRPLANDFQLDRAGDLVVLLDTRPTGLGPPYDERLLGIAKAAAFGIAEAFLRGKVRIGLAVFGEFVDAVPLSTGRIHRLRLQKRIDDVRLASSPGPAPRCAYGLRRYFRPGVTTLVVSAWAGEDTGELSPYLQRQGYPVVLLTPSTAPLDAASFDLPAGEEQLARAIERLERRVRLAPLWLHGPVIDWEEYWSLSSLVHYMRQPVWRRRG